MDTTYARYIFQSCIPFKLLYFLFIASEKGLIEVAKLLIERGADVESKDFSLSIFVSFALKIKKTTTNYHKTKIKIKLK